MAATMPEPTTVPDDGDVFGPIANYLGFVVRAPARRKVLAALVIVVATAIGIAAGQVLPFKYHVEAAILAQRNAMVGALLNPGVHRDRDWAAPTRAARETVMRRENLLAICEKTDFVRRDLVTRAPAVRARDWFRAKLGRTPSSAERLAGAVAALESQLVVFPARDDLVSIHFYWTDPDLAHDVVRAAVQSFLDARSAAEIGALGEAMSILQAHDARVQEEISAAIVQLEEKERALRPAPAPRAAGSERPSRHAREELARIREVLSTQQRALANLEDFRQRRLFELQLQLVQLQTVYAPGHPSVISTEQNIDRIRSPSPQAAELEAEIAELKKQAIALGADERDLSRMTSANAEIAAARDRMLRSENPRLEYERRQLDGLLQRHASLVDRIDTARIEMDMNQAAFEQRYTIVKPPRRPAGPIKPYKLMLGVGGLVGGVLLAFVAAAIAELWSGRIVEPWQVAQKLALPVLGEVRR